MVFINRAGISGMVPEEKKLELGSNALTFIAEGVSNGQEISGTNMTKPQDKVDEAVLTPFQAGGIHRAEVRDFWKTTLKASEWVLELLDMGYVIPFQAIPGSYREKNNKSAREKPEVVRSLMADMIQKNVVKIVDRQPHCVSPLGLVSKVQPDGTVKHRLIWDGSRHVNKFLKVAHVRLAHLEKALEITLPGDFQVTFDMTSAYYHVKVHPEQTQFLGAEFEDNGKTVWVEYLVLPFGLASAVHAITKVFKPLQGHFNGMGIRSSIFIDDGRILATSKEEAEMLRVKVYGCLAAAGWALAPDKSDKIGEASQVKKYLGFRINTLEMKVYALEEKLHGLVELLESALSVPAMPVKRLASLLGKIVALEPSHAMLARIATRTGYEILARHTDEHGWKGCIVTTPELKNELRFFKDHMFEANGARIRTAATAVRLETILPNPVAMTRDIPSHRPSEQFLISDASSVKAFVYGLGMSDAFELQMTFTEDQRLLSSTGRELLALLFTLRHWQNQGQELPASVYWVTDSSSAAACASKGSKSPAVQKLVLEIAQICMATGIQVVPLHLRREDPRIQLADEGSKLPDSDNWSIDHRSFQELHEKFNFEFDLFASHDNAKVSRFCSLYFQPSAQSIEAWSLDWNTLPMMWVCPPVSALVKLFHRLTLTRCEGVVCLPMWSTATFYPLFFTEFGKPRPPFKVEKIWHPYIVQNEGAKNTPLYGYTPFAFAALYFCTK